MQLLSSGDALTDKDIPLHWLEKTANTTTLLARRNLTYMLTPEGGHVPHV